MSKIIEPDFSSQTVKADITNCNFSSVKFGANSIVLESELNQLQEIQNMLRQNLAKEVVGNGVINAEGITVKNDKLCFDNVAIIANGVMFRFNDLQLDVSGLSDIYFSITNNHEVRDSDRMATDGIYGSNKKVSVLIIDPRVGYETTRRTQYLCKLSGEAITHYNFSEKIGVLEKGKFKLAWNNLDSQSKFQPKVIKTLQELNKNFDKYKKDLDDYKDTFDSHKKDFDDCKKDLDSYKKDFDSHKKDFDNYRVDLEENFKIINNTEPIQIDRPSVIVNPLDCYNYVGSTPVSKDKLFSIPSGNFVFNPYASIQINDFITHNIETKNAMTETKLLCEDLRKDLRENSSKTITKQDYSINLTGSTNSIVNATVQGCTLKNLIHDSKLDETSSAYGFGCRYVTEPLIAGKEYTLIVNGRIDKKALSEKKSLACFIYKKGWGEYVNSLKIDSIQNTTEVLKITPSSTADFEVTFYQYPKDGNREGKVTVNWCMLLEGDWTSKPLPTHFYNLISFGDMHKVELTSCGKNLFNYKSIHATNGNAKIKNITDGINIKTDTKVQSYSCAIFYPKIKQNTTYTFQASFKQIKGVRGCIEIKTPEYTYALQDKNNMRCTFTTGMDISSFRIQLNANETNVGEPCEIEVTNIQLEEGNTTTPYKPYEEDKVSCTLKEHLRSLPNGNRDILNSDGVITRNLGAIYINGSENWKSSANPGDKTIMFLLEGLAKPNQTEMYNLLSSMFTNRVIYSTTEYEGIYISLSGNLYIRLYKSRLKTQDVTGFKNWLSQNNITVIYELKEPRMENLGQPLSLKCFNKGSIRINNNMPPILSVKYASNINNRLNTVEDALSNVKTNLGGAWKVLLSLADKDLKMKSIAPLSGTDSISKKINEMLGVWK